MDINSIAESSPAPIYDLPASGGSSFVGSSAEATKEQFLHLLVSQLKNQNPLEPLTNEQFLGQLAQFTGVEEQQKTTEAIQQLVQLNAANSSISHLAEASAFLGKSVDYIDPATGDDANGVVTSVGIDQGAVVVKIGTKSVPLILITGVKEPAAGDPEESNS